MEAPPSSAIRRLNLVLQAFVAVKGLKLLEKDRVDGFLRRVLGSYRILPVAGFSSSLASEHQERQPMTTKGRNPDASKPLLPNRRAASIIAAMRDCLPSAVPFAGSVYRMASLKWCTAEHLLSGGSVEGGSWSLGGRWNPPGAATGAPKPLNMPEARWLLREGFRTAYTLLDIGTVIREIAWHARQLYPKVELDTEFWATRRVGKATVKLSRILDVRADTVLSRLKARPRDLIGEWESLEFRGYETFTQLIGRAARLHGFEGIMCPSARHRPEGVNLVLFPDCCGEREKWVESIEIMNGSLDVRKFLEPQ
jgi:hypothetical protein